MGAEQDYNVFIIFSGTARTRIRRNGSILPPNAPLCRELIHIGMHIPQGHAPRAMRVPGRVLAETKTKKR